MCLKSKSGPQFLQKRGPYTKASAELIGKRAAEYEVAAINRHYAKKFPELRLNKVGVAPPCPQKFISRKVYRVPFIAKICRYMVLHVRIFL